MSSSSGKSKRKKKSGKPVGPRPAPDRTVYLALIIIGVFFAFLAGLMTDGKWEIAAIVYLAIIAWFVNAAAYAVYRGQHIAYWRQSLARLPLRCVGYGSKGGKPIDAAHDHPEVMRMLMISVMTSIVVIAAIAIWLIPELRVW